MSRQADIDVISTLGRPCESSSIAMVDGRSRMKEDDQKIARETLALDVTYWLGVPGKVAQDPLQVFSLRMAMIVKSMCCAATAQRLGLHCSHPF